LDAQATKVSVYANDLVKFVVTDNGTGIAKDDFGNLCRRHCTSKLRLVSDLQTIQTFGFRGEGLAAISAVSFVSVRSRTKEAQMAWEASYERGEVKGALKPAPGNPGTVITVENLYFNDREKRDYYNGRIGDELKLIEKLIQSYAIHYSSIAFSFKKEKTSTLAVSTPGNSSAIAVIGLIFGKHVADNLLPLSINLQELGIRVDGFITNSMYSGVKTDWILFVNNRLISDAPEFKKAIKVICFVRVVFFSC
jgi:DNA mismatch repair protein MLH1